jgi:hypothetical protein
MSPHKQDPPSWEIEIDLSEILIRRDEVKTKKVESGNALLDWTDWSLDVGDTGISSSGWANISFVLGSCLIGFICALSIFDTSNIRGEGHVDRTTLSVRGRNLIRHDHNVSVWNLLPGPSQVAYSKQSPTLSTFTPFGEDRSPALSPSIGVADRESTNASSPLRSDIGAPELGSRTTASSAENVSRNEQTTSRHSSRRALTRSARKPIVTSRTNVSSSWRNFQRSWARGLRKSRAANSTSGTRRHTVSSGKFAERRLVGPRFRS